MFKLQARDVTDGTTKPDQVASILDQASKQETSRAQVELTWHDLLDSRIPSSGDLRIVPMQIPKASAKGKVAATQKEVAATQARLLDMTTMIRDNESETSTIDG